MVSGDALIEYAVSGDGGLDDDWIDDERSGDG
jgi:hypothetical protein